MGYIKAVDVLPDELISEIQKYIDCLLSPSPSPRDVEESRMPDSA